MSSHIRRVLLEHRFQRFRDGEEVLHEKAVNVYRYEERSHLRCDTRERGVFERLHAFGGNSDFAW